MTWDQLSYQVRMALPSVEAIIYLSLIIALYFVLQYRAGVRLSVRTAARDLVIVAVTWYAASILVRLDEQNHWLQRSAAWWSNLFG